MDEEQKFKAKARRNSLLGLWVAEKLGITGDAATAYAKEVVAADFEQAGDNDVVRKVTRDLAAKGIALTEAQLRAKMDELLAQAIDAGEGGDVSREAPSTRRPGERRTRNVRGLALAFVHSGAYISQDLAAVFGCRFSGSDQVSHWCWRRSVLRGERPAPKPRL